jgi:hypothetical protein
VNKYFIILIEALVMSPASAENGKPTVYGKTMGNWGQAWWQWALNFPSADNPLLQSGQVDCSAGQSGKVWYLAGTFGGSAERTCSVPEGKALFVPILNSIMWTPDDCAVNDLKTCREKNAGNNLDTISSWTCTVDGVPCVWFTQVVRAQSAPRPLNLPAGSIAVTDFGYTPGLREKSIADGYAVMLHPLSRGQHTVHITSSGPGGTPPFSLDVTYHLTVKRKFSR